MSCKCKRRRIYIIGIPSSCFMKEDEEEEGSMPCSPFTITRAEMKIIQEISGFRVTLSVTGSNFPSRIIAYVIFVLPNAVQIFILDRISPTLCRATKVIPSDQTTLPLASPNGTFLQENTVCAPIIAPITPV